jgi:diaminopimelate decarboxylase
MLDCDWSSDVCSSDLDFLAKDRKLHMARPGDLIAVMSAGAYGFSMSSNYNSRPRAAEVMVSGSRFEVVRERELIRELAGGEREPSFLARGRRKAR